MTTIYDRNEVSPRETLDSGRCPLECTRLTEVIIGVASETAVGFSLMNAISSLTVTLGVWALYPWIHALRGNYHGAAYTVDEQQY